MLKKQVNRYPHSPQVNAIAIIIMHQEEDYMDGCSFTFLFLILFAVRALTNWLLPDYLNWITHLLEIIILLFLLAYMIMKKRPPDDDPPYLW